MHFSLVLMLGLSLSGWPEKSVETISAEVTKISQSMEIDPESKAKSISRIYRAEVVPITEDRTRLGDEQLHKLFSITGATFFYSRFVADEDSASILRDLRGVLSDLEQRGAAKQGEIVEVYEGMVGMRLFDGAMALAKRHPNQSLTEIPPYTTAAGFDPNLPAMFSLADDGKSLYLHNVETKRGRLVVIVAQCHYARDAALQISQDAELAKALRAGNAVWLQSASEPLSPSDLRTWNSFFPEQPLSIAFADKAWRGVSFASSPGFFFFEDGKLVSQQRGWSGKTGKTELQASLRKMGASSERD